MKKNYWTLIIIARIEKFCVNCNAFILDRLHFFIHRIIK